MPECPNALREIFLVELIFELKKTLGKCLNNPRVFNFRFIALLNRFYLQGTILYK